MNKSQILTSISESLMISEAKNFNPKDLGMSGSPTLWSVDGKGAITWDPEEKEFQVIYDQDSSDYDTAKTSEEAMKLAKANNLKFDLDSIKAATEYFSKMGK